MKKYTIALETEDDGRISAHCLELPGCHSWGDNRDEALKNIREAIEGYMERRRGKVGKIDLYVKITLNK